jgi:prevent-host-death family protein
MALKVKNIGAFDAKTHLGQLLKDVQGGSEIVITKRGKPIARLIPYKENTAKMNKKEILDNFDRIRNSVKGKVNIVHYINEGRKY